MFKKPDILDRDHGTAELFGNFRQGRLDATFNEKLTDALLVAGIDLRDETGLVRLQLV
ncbi:MAG: hypothetical protein JW388_1280 [Nitrospira sp.]|nr:hypothetical protein [Nitrospira sp.]